MQQLFLLVNPFFRGKRTKPVTQLDVVRVVQPAVPNSTMSGDGTMLENCWASLVIALLEKDHKIMWIKQCHVYHPFLGMVTMYDL
jgi:hypothetical protein